MLPLVAAAVVAGPDFIDWARATDDMRFALLKPVMTETEVRRLFAGKESFKQACGAVDREDGKTVPYCGGGYVYTLTGPARTATIMTDRTGPAPDEPRPPPEKWWTLARFRVHDGPTYKRNQDGLYEVQPKK